VAGFSSMRLDCVVARYPREIHYLTHGIAWKILLVLSGRFFRCMRSLPTNSDVGVFLIINEYLGYTILTSKIYANN
jgi:hypothetical protein